ncbi:MAG: GTP-binding protein [Spirochaetales bacterium]|jgi:G3E family GTPase|nr:GTP-binding protein [Spirochaetales bacterium]
MSNTQVRNEEKIPLYVIIGFLGSGKTSLLNSLLEQAFWQRTGIILNDFGSLNIDTSLIRRRDGVTAAELSGGQIFCSCLSGNFVSKVAEFADIPIDVLLVEASGLAKPNPLLEIMEWADKKSNHKFDFKGMICIIDAERYAVLSQAVNAVNEQVVFSDLFIVNKCDLADDDVLESIDKELLLLRPGAQIYHTTYGRIPVEILTQITKAPDVLRGIDPKEYAGWGSSGRPVPIHLQPKEVISEKRLLEAMQAISPLAFRVKGYVNTTEQGMVLVNCVGKNISLEKSLTEAQQKLQPGLIVISQRKSELILMLGTFWREKTGSDADVTTG